MASAQPRLEQRGLTSKIIHLLESIFKFRWRVVSALVPKDKRKSLTLIFTNEVYVLGDQH